MLSNGKLPYLLIVAAVVLVAFGHWTHYASSPLGRFPVLDARENLAWAERILAGDLPGESFYRALGYPAVLAVLDAATGALSLAIVASGFGLVLHFLNAWLVALIARKVWRDCLAGWLAGACYGLYPVSLYFAVQLFDVTLGISLFLGAILATVWGGREERSLSQPAVCEVAAGLLMGLAVLVRPHFLLPALARPIWMLAGGSIATACHSVARCFSPRRRSHRAALAGPGTKATRHGILRCGFWPAAWVALPLIGILLVQGLLNLALGGEFRVLPWQGAYNLYAANKAGADGRYFEQSVYFDELPKGANPTRRESELLYALETGAEPPYSIDEMNIYWRAKTVYEVLEDPFGWLALLGRKAVYLFNDWEQYNNLTYAFHKERSPWLNWNPLGWGVLLVFGGVGWLAGPRDSRWRSNHLMLLFLFAAYGAGVVLFFASARFRLPLVPLLAIGLGGLIPLGRELWRKRDPRLAIGVAALALALSVLTFPNWLNARDTSTFLQDHILLATAAMEAGNDRLALEQAENALARDPSRPDAIRLAMAARFNLLLMGKFPAEPEQWQRLRKLHERLPGTDRVSDFIGATALWQTGDRQAALEAWKALLKVHGQAAASSAKALQAVGAAKFFPRDDPEIKRLRHLLLGDQLPTS